MNLDYLITNKIIFRRDPVNDKPDAIHAWGRVYSAGTYEYYDLFRYNKAMISSYKSFKWHLYVLWYLNPKMDPDEFETMSKVICNKQNGFVTFTPSLQVMHSINYEVSMSDLDKSPPNKLRKVIFKSDCDLSMSSKLSIVGQMVGRKRLSDSEIYEAMLIIHDNKEKISISKISKMLKCSTRTVYRNIGNELKKEKELLNREL